ncbi:unnamed protein product [Penicillium crustosum]
MTRGNQRDNDRAKALKKAGNTKNKNTQSGSEFARSKDDAAAIMREKQRKDVQPTPWDWCTDRFSSTADEKKAAEAAAGGGKKK